MCVISTVLAIPWVRREKGKSGSVSCYRDEGGTVE